MARRKCHTLKLITYLCVVCVSLDLLLTFLTNMESEGVTDTAPTEATAENKENSTDKAAFGELPNFRKKISAPLPKAFWQTGVRSQGLWNDLQEDVDMHFNPILRPKNDTSQYEDRVFTKLVMNQSFSKISNFTNTNDEEQLPRMLQDFVHNMQRRDYPVLIQPRGVCGAGAQEEMEFPLLLLAIKSIVSNFKGRQAIRNSWGRTGWASGGGGGGYVRRIFLLGTSSEQQNINLAESLQSESSLYGDILQWDFKDTAFNQTLKDVLFWRWSSLFCEGTQFVFSGDDNVFVNVPKMVTYLREQLKSPRAEEKMKNFIVGKVVQKKAKYFFPDSFYQGTFPVFVDTVGLVYSGHLTQRLNQISRRVHLFPIDNIYLGMCLLRLKVDPVHHPTFLKSGSSESYLKDICVYHKIMVVETPNHRDLGKIWARLNSTQSQCS